MSKPTTPRGEASRLLAANMKRLREAQRIPFREMAKRLAELGSPISPASICRIEAHIRVVTVDELAAIATVLTIPAGDLLTPNPTCRHCEGEPPAGYQCRTCGAESARTS